MMVPDHASPCAWGTASPSFLAPIDCSAARPRGPKSAGPPCLTSVGPRNGQQTTSAYARRNETVYEAAAVGGEGSKPRAIANHLDDKELAVPRMTMDRQLPNCRRPSRHRRHEPPLVSVTGKIRLVVVPEASRSPLESVRRPSAEPTRAPRDRILPSIRSSRISRVIVLWNAILISRLV